MAATQASGKAPRKIRNSLTKLLRPGRPSEEKSTMPMSPAKITGAGLRRPSKSSIPRRPPVRNWIMAMNQKMAAAVDAVIEHLVQDDAVERGGLAGLNHGDRACETGTAGTAMAKMASRQ